MTPPAAPIAMATGVPVIDLDPIAERINQLADLLNALAVTSEHGRLQQGAITVAATFATDTADRLCVVLDKHH